MGAPIGLGQLRSNTYDYFDRVATGETLEVARRGKVVARIVPSSVDLPHPPNPDDSIEVAACIASAPVALSKFRRNPAVYFDRVAAGESIGIIDRDVLVARIVATAASSSRSQRTNAARRRRGGRDGMPQQPTRT